MCTVLYSIRHIIRSYANGRTCICWHKIIFYELPVCLDAFRCVQTEAKEEIFEKFTKSIYPVNSKILGYGVKRFYSLNIYFIEEN